MSCSRWSWPPLRTAFWRSSIASRRCPWAGGTWAALRLPHVEAYEVRAGAHRLASFVPDARGFLLVTDAHLARAGDLSARSLDALGGGRHLLRAKHLEPWLAGQQVDPDVMARARADLGDMVMTHADLGG